MLETPEPYPFAFDVRAQCPTGPLTRLRCRDTSPQHGRCLFIVKATVANWAATAVWARCDFTASVMIRCPLQPHRRCPLR
jgi:hypothetical protein